MLSLIFSRTEGVKFVSTLPGDDILPIFDALHENGQVPLILTRHEQATVYIADGYARSTGEVGCGDGDERAGPLQCIYCDRQCFYRLRTAGGDLRPQLAQAAGEGHAARSAVPGHFSNHGEMDFQRAVAGKNTRSVSPRLYPGALRTARSGDHRNPAGYQHGAGGDASLSANAARALRSRS